LPVLEEASTAGNLRRVTVGRLFGHPLTALSFDFVKNMQQEPLVKLLPFVVRYPSIPQDRPHHERKFNMLQLQKSVPPEVSKPVLSLSKGVKRAFAGGSKGRILAKLQDVGANPQAGWPCIMSKYSLTL
jgi:hypothetical protein